MRRIPAFQRGFSPGPAWTDGDGLQMACGASGYMTGPHYRAWTTPPYPTPPLNLTASPALLKLPSRPTPGSGWLGFCPHKTFSSFPNNFSLILAMFWQLQDLFLLSFNLPYASSHRRPKPCRTSRNAKHLQWVTAAEVPARAVPDWGREWGGGGVGVAAANLCQGLDQEEEWQHWLKGGKKTTRKKSVQGPLLWNIPPAPHGLELPALQPHPLSPIHFPREKATWTMRGCKLAGGNDPDSTVTNNQKELSPQSFAVSTLFTRHSLKMQWAFFPFYTNRGHSLALPAWRHSSLLSPGRAFGVKILPLSMFLFVTMNRENVHNIHPKYLKNYKIRSKSPLFCPPQPLAPHPGS